MTARSKTKQTEVPRAIDSSKLILSVKGPKVSIPLVIKRDIARQVAESMLKTKNVKFSHLTSSRQIWVKKESK